MFNDKEVREIKFRAWGPNTKHMWSWEESQGCSIKGFFNGGGESIQMQFTGLKDKNGKEIYEGDIVCPDKNNQNEKTVGSVEWHEQLACFIVRYKDGTGWKSFIEMEVIGNIYENPELLRKDL